MLTAGLNLATIVAVGSGLSEGRTYGDNVYATPSAAGVSGKPYNNGNAGTDHTGTTVV